MFVAGLVLAAGSSRRLGRPKQLLPYRGATLLDATLETARRCSFDQLLVAVGGSATEVRRQVDLSGCTVVDSVHHTQGCGSSIVSALEHVDRRADALVLLLGDQPSVEPDTVVRIAELDEPIAVCRYDDGLGHPFRFARELFPELAVLHGDKAVWKVIESGHVPVTELRVPGPVPPDVDTWDDYEQLVGDAGE